MSQLMINLTASSSVIGQTVECVHLDNIAETAIGSTTIEIAGCELAKLILNHSS